MSSLHETSGGLEPRLTLCDSKRLTPYLLWSRSGTKEHNRPELQSKQTSTSTLHPVRWAKKRWITNWATVCSLLYVDMYVCLVLWWRCCIASSHGGSWCGRAVMERIHPFIGCIACNVCCTITIHKLAGAWLVNALPCVNEVENKKLGREVGMRCRDLFGVSATLR